MKQKIILLDPHLEAFMAVAKHKSIHGGARSIHLSQTAVTQRMHSLESKLETCLFVRSRHGVTLTPEGEALLRYCHTVVDLSGEALAHIVGAGTSTAIQIAVTGPTSVMTSRIIPQCLTVMKKFPQLRINFDVNDTDHRITSLRAGYSQFAVVEPEHVAKEMEVKRLKPERYLLVCSKAWKKRTLRDIVQSERIIDFDESDAMSFNYLKQYDLFKLARLERLFVNNTESLAKMIMEGYGYGVLSEEFSKPYLNKNQIIALNGGKAYENQIVLAWYARPEPPVYFSGLIKAIN